MTAVPSSGKEKEGGTKGRLVPLPPDGGWGWVVVVGSFLIHVFADGFVYSFGVLVETLMKEFDSDNATCALIISLLTGLTLGSGPLASAVCNKYGCRTTTIVGSMIAFVGCAMSYFATAMWHIVVSVGCVMGLGFGLMYCPAIVIVTMYFEKHRSLATGIAVAGAGVGTVLFSPINAFIIREYGWRTVFLAFLVVLVLCGVCGSTFRPIPFVEITEDLAEEEKKEKEEKEEDEEKTEDDARKAKESTTLLVPDSNGHRVRASSHSESLGKAAVSRSLSHVGPSTDPEHLGVAATLSRSRCGTISEKEVGYLNRKDVFYTGSITNVAEFREDPDKYRSTGSLHKRSMGHLAHSTGKLDKVREISENSEEESTDNTEGRNMFKTISKMLSLSLLLDPTFLLFAVSNLLTSVGFNSPLYFLPLHAQKGVHLSPEEAAKVLSAFGVMNTIGRVVFGVVGDRKLPLPYGWGEDTARNRLWMYNISLALCGVITVFCYTFDSYISLSVYAALFGFSISSYICLTSVILVDLLGLEKLTNAFGLLLLWQGIGTVFGPPIAGLLADWTNNYTMSFVFCGVNLLISGLMLFVIPHYQKKAKLEQELSEM